MKGNQREIVFPVDQTLDALETFPMDCCHESLEVINISGHRLESLPKEIAKLKNLRRLDLSNNALTRLPDEIQHLESLEYLNLRGNNLTDLNTGLWKLKKLKALFLDGNNLIHEKALEGLQNLTELQYFSACNCKLKSLNLGVLSKLVAISISNNKELSDLPKSISSQNGLKVLEISGCQLGVWPETNGPRPGDWPTALFGLTSLEHLEMSDNQLSAPSEEFANLTNLRILDLSHNPMGEKKLSENQTQEREVILPGNQLRHINLDGCSLEQIPATLCEQADLNYLSLQNNRLEFLPLRMGKLKHLKKLFLNQNPLVFPPPHLMNETSDDALPVIQHLNHMNQVQPVRRVRLFQLHTEEPEDLEMTIFKEPELLPTRDFRIWKHKGEDGVQWDVWEMGPNFFENGGERFLGEETCYLLIHHDSELGRLNYENYLELLKIKAPDAPVLTARLSETGGWPGDAPDVHTVAFQDGKAGAEALTSLEHEIRQKGAALAQALKPLSWLQILEKMDEIKERTLSRRELELRCMAHGVPLDELESFLRSQGVVSAPRENVFKTAPALLAKNRYYETVKQKQKIMKDAEPQHSNGFSQGQVHQILEAVEKKGDEVIGTVEESTQKTIKSLETARQDFKSILYDWAGKNEAAKYPRFFLFWNKNGKTTTELGLMGVTIQLQFICEAEEHGHPHGELYEFTTFPQWHKGVDKVIRPMLKILPLMEHGFKAGGQVGFGEISAFMKNLVSNPAIQAEPPEDDDSNPILVRKIMEKDPHKHQLVRTVANQKYLWLCSDHKRQADANTPFTSAP